MVGVLWVVLGLVSLGCCFWRLWLNAGGGYICVEFLGVMPSGSRSGVGLI